MFKNFFAVPPPGKLLFGLLLLICGLTACRTPPLPKADFSQPGWKVFQGQAVWRNKRSAPEISGEILLAKKSDGQVFVQFTKTPFPFVVAQSTTNTWRLDFPTENKSFSAFGHPPVRVIWFQFAHAGFNSALPKKWSWQIETNDTWRLENLSTGELLEGYFSK